MTGAERPFQGLNIHRLVASWSTQRADREAVVFDRDGRRESITYGDLADRVFRLAEFLHRELALEPGERVGVATGNCPEFLISIFALQSLGATAVAIHASSTAAELESCLTRTHCVGVVVGPQLAGAYEEMVADRGSAGPPRWALELEGVAQAAPPHPALHRVTWADALAADAPAPADRMGRDTSDLSEALILFTSGSTGLPKPVVWTQANVLWAGKVGASHAGLQPEDRFLVHLPLAHVVSLSYSTLSTLWAGGTVILAERYSASGFWPLAVRERATWSHAISFVVKTLRAFPVPDDHCFRRWIFARSNTEWEEVFGIPTMGVWGMTEMVSQPIYHDGVSPVAEEAIGHPALEYELRIVDQEGDPLPSGSEGFLQVRGVRGLSVALRYDTDDGGWDHDGWFATGDIVRREPDGSIRYMSRGKDVVTVGGETVYCKEIERVVEQDEAVREAVVVGRPDPVRGEVPVAFVIPRAQEGDAGFDDRLVERLADHCEAELSTYKRPHEFRVVEEIPRTATGKPDKPRLKLQLADA